MTRGGLRRPRRVIRGGGWTASPRLPVGVPRLVARRPAPLPGLSPGPRCLARERFRASLHQGGREVCSVAAV